MVKCISYCTVDFWSALCKAYVTHPASAVSPVRTHTMALALSGCWLENICSRAMTCSNWNKGTFIAH